MREIGRFAAIARGFMANELTASPLEAKHRQLIRLIWTRNGTGGRYCKVLAPDMPYRTEFEARVTGPAGAGAEEGWVRFVFPLAPTPDESAYRLELDDEERFVRELEALVEGAGRRHDRLVTGPVAAALAGESADRPPVALWRHFPDRDQTAQGLAAATVQWQTVSRATSSSSCRRETTRRSIGACAASSMAPQRDAAPIFHPVSQAADWERLPNLDVREGFSGEMLHAVTLARRDLPADVPLLQTLFSPLTVAAKLSGDGVPSRISGSRAAVHAGLRRIAEVTGIRRGVVRGRGGGCSSPRSSPTARDCATTRSGKWVPYDLQIFDALPVAAPLLLHPYGDAPMLDLAAATRPGALLARSAPGPSLREVASSTTSAATSSKRRSRRRPTRPPRPSTPCARSMAAA